MAGWKLKHLGYGEFEITDRDNPSSPPQVEAAVAAPAYDSFTRILQGQVDDDEELRVEKPMSYGMGYEYVGLGPNGANTGVSVWDVVRVEWINKHRTRIQYRANIAWDTKEIGW